MLTSYAYRAARADGAIETGTLDAPSREAASATLARGGLFPIEITLRTSTHARQRSLGTAALALGFRLLADLLEAGLPIARALAAFEGLAPAAWRPGLPRIQQAIREGKTLATALAASGLGVPALAIGIVQAGEAGSSLAPAVRRAAELLERAAETRAAIRAALSYPAILAAAGGASMAFLVAVVLPRFALILADLGETLPPTTRLVLAAASLLHAGTVPALVAMAALGVLARAWRRSAGGAQQWDAALLGLPLIGSVRRSAAA